MISAELIENRLGALITRYRSTFVRTALITLIAAALVLAFRVADPDLFARVAVGRLVLHQGKVSLHDPFAFTPVKKLWFDHEWISGVLFYSTSQFANGDVALILLTIACAALTLLVIHQAQSYLSPTPVLNLFLLIGLLPGLGFVWSSVIRSQVFTFFGFALVILATVRVRKHARIDLLLLLPAYFAFWWNAHAGCVVGLGFLIIFSLAALLDRIPRYRVAYLVTLLCTASALINPYGIGYLRFILEAVFKNRARIIEWQPFPLLSAGALPFYISLPFVYLLFRAPKRRVPLEGKIFVALTLLEGLCHQRLIGFFFVCVMVYGAPGVVTLVGSVRRHFSLHAFGNAIAAWILLVSMAGALGLIALPFSSTLRTLDYTDLPVRAIRYLRTSGRSGNLLVHFNEGSYALWMLYPRFKVSMDGRYEEVYPDTTVEAELQIFDAQNPAEIVNASAGDHLLVCNTTSSIEPLARFGDRWNLLYRDEQCAVLSTKLMQPPAAPVSSPESRWEPLF